MCATKRFFSRFPIDSKRDFTASAVRLTTSSSVEIRSSRCSSNGISSWGSPASSTTPTPERTSSFELQRAQNSSSSGFFRPQTWQYISGRRVLVEARPDFLPSQPASTMRTSSGHGRYFGSPNPSWSTRRMARHVSRPMKSASWSGPMGWFIPSFMIPSIASFVATPSRSA